MVQGMEAHAVVSLVGEVLGESRRGYEFNGR